MPNRVTPLADKQPVAPRVFAMRSTRRYRSIRNTRRGFSLLEVMLATGILLGSVVVLGELARLGSRNVQAACAETEAERLAQSVLSQVTAEGGLPEQAVDQPIENTPGWLYSIEIEPLDRPSLSAVRITVAQDLPEEKQPVRYTLVRWRSFSEEDADADVSSSSAAAKSMSKPAAKSSTTPSPAASPGSSSRPASSPMGSRASPTRGLP